MIRPILLLGDPALYEKSVPVLEDEMERLSSLIIDLHDTLLDYRLRYGAGRAIAAPQIGVAKRVLYMNTGEAMIFVNPALEPDASETLEVLDDCMCFPGLRVRVRRFRRCTIRFRDELWRERSLELEGDLSELLQHEYDHLDGVLATMRAIDDKAFFLVI